MKNKILGYTLIELIMAISLLMIVLIGGTTIFYKSLRSSGLSDIQTVLNSSLRSLDEMIERSLLYGSVISVSGENGVKSREDCIALGLEGEGVSGNTLEFMDASGGEAVYSLLADGTVSSNSGVIISNPGIYVKELSFTWYCRSGVNDKIDLYIEATSSAKTGDAITSTLRKNILLLNSGIN